MDILMDDARLAYMGRIDFTDEKRPILIYAGSMVKICFQGTGLEAVIHNLHNWNENYLGIVVDGKYVNRLLLSQKDASYSYVIVSHLQEGSHEVILYKCQDSVHYVQLESLRVMEGDLVQAPEFPKRRLEFFGDSVTAGACCEAHGYVGKPDPESRGEYCNAWYSYSMIAARMLHASIHNVAQGGISLLKDTGYFEMDTGTRGMLDVYDKLRYVSRFCVTPWDFSKYIPHVVVVAIGQNDNYPDSTVEENGGYLNHWKEKYKELLRKIRLPYPNAEIICITTILVHNPIWDQKIEEACMEMGDPHIHKLTFKRNGKGTNGHPRIVEQYEMAEELVNHINGLGDGIWK